MLIGADDNLHTLPHISSFETVDERVSYVRVYCERETQLWAPASTGLMFPFFLAAAVVGVLCLWV